MDKELKAKWVAALRSNEYRQGRGQLYSEDADAYCCLGVLCEVAGLERKGTAFHYEDDESDGLLPSAFAKSIGIHVNPRVWDGIQKQGLSELNDNGVAFAVIASLIEDHL